MNRFDRLLRTLGKYGLSGVGDTVPVGAIERPVDTPRSSIGDASGDC
ncbi:MAG: hypothetical protein OXN92_09625 [Gammaproteobacteria bacterium]|nr:hypothetical protein [Gammaproteobacteria bacterium]